MYDEIIQDLIFSNFVCNSLEAKKNKKKDVYERDHQQQEEMKARNRETSKHLVISDESISMEWVTRYPLSIDSKQNRK